MNLISKLFDNASRHENRRVTMNQVRRLNAPLNIYCCAQIVEERVSHLLLGPNGFNAPGIGISSPGTVTLMCCTRPTNGNAFILKTILLHYTISIIYFPEPVKYGRQRPLFSLTFIWFGREYLSFLEFSQIGSYQCST